ncbi:MAG TPA: DUF6526 family protein [Edaphobacter sp.]|nr:DUF6526 family protein [Edaphobacter sp.]
MPPAQNLKNHTRWYPPFHFFVLPILLLNFIFSIYVTIHHWPTHWALNFWWILMSTVFFVMAGIAREGSLTTQDRVIRLEERLRLAALVPAEERAHIDELSVKQLIALRFASDGELPALFRKTLTQNLEPKDIKRSIVNWRGDYHRV